MTTRLARDNPIRIWSLGRNAQGHRIYKVAHLVKADPEDGPYNALNTPGLPTVGSQWNFRADFDGWAWCTPEAEVKVHQEKEGDPSEYWLVTQTFSSKRGERCQDQEILDPLLEPDRVSGSFQKDKKTGVYDKDGNAIVNSAHEQIKGNVNEWDEGWDVVRIQQNVYPLGIETFAPMRNRVNNAPLWGFAARCVKLSDVTWEEVYQGTCEKYFVRTLEFEVKSDTWDRTVDDEGTKFLKGRWVAEGGSHEWVVDSGANPDNPADFIRAIDVRGNPVTALLNGAGRPYNISPTGTGDDTPGTITIQKYLEANFLTLGIPATIGT